MEIGCATDKLPFQYLGMPLGAKANSKSIWDPILIKFDEFLSLWKQSSYSKGGKLTLLKLFFPLYLFITSLYLGPLHLSSSILKKKERFSLEHKPSSKTSHLINYDLVCAYKFRGGLGILNIKVMNSALLSKWCWRFVVEKNHLWYKIISEKYGTESSFWVPGKVTSPFGISYWKTIAEERVLIDKFSTLTVHNGANIFITSAVIIHLWLLSHLYSSYPKRNLLQ